VRHPGDGDRITDELMDMSHIVRLIDQVEDAPKKRGPYKKRESAGTTNG
jgi:hypothetical protein